MYEVHVYTSVSSKGPKRQNVSGFYCLETQTAKGPARLENTVEVTATANQAELIVLNEALKRICGKCSIIIHTDSKYVAAGFRQGWIEKWKMNGWRNARGEPVANSAEWQKTLNLLGEKPFQVMINEKAGENAQKR